jgi:CubicO group peptidase (beta-lactamase class C family)
VLTAVGRALAPQFGCLMAPSRAPGAVNSAGGACRRGRRWLLVVVLACVLAAACTSQQREQPAPTGRSPALAGHRDYWPTAGWRTAPPAEAGMDPKVLAVLDTNVAYHPQLRSLLVVRHGYLVYERYWNGDAGTGQEAFSVTKSFTGALVGIALGDHHLKSLNQTVGELLAAHLPPNAGPAACQGHRRAAADHDLRAGL